MVTQKSMVLKMVTVKSMELVTVKSMELASFTLGLLGIVAILLVWGSPRPGPDVLPGTPSAQACHKWLHQEDYSSVVKCFQWLASMDVGVSDTVDEASGFPDMVFFVIVHILANISLLYGVFQSNSRFIVVFIIYYILTNILGFIIGFSLPIYESNLLTFCIFPMESSVGLLYGFSGFLVLLIAVMKTLLFLCTVVLLLKMNDNKKNAKPVSENKTQGDLVFVVPV